MFYDVVREEAKSPYSVGIAVRCEVGKRRLRRSPYSCNKIGQGISARFRRFSNCSSLVFFFRLQPEFPSVEGGVGVCLGLPLKSQHGAFLAVYGGQTLGFSFGDMTLPLSFSKQHSVYESPFSDTMRLSTESISASLSLTVSVGVS